MADEIRIQVKSNKIDNRSQIFLGRRNLGRQIDKLVLMMSRDSPTEILFTMRPKGVSIKAPSARRERFLTRIIEKFIKGEDGK